MADNPKTAALRAEPEANWNDIWSMMQELGAATAPLMELSSPPSWAVSLRFVMDAALPDVEERCAKDNSDG